MHSFIIWVIFLLFLNILKSFKMFKCSVSYPCRWWSCCSGGWCSCQPRRALQQRTDPHSAGRSTCRKWCRWDTGGCGRQGQLLWQRMTQHHHWGSSWQSLCATRTEERAPRLRACTGLCREDGHKSQVNKQNVKSTLEKNNFCENPAWVQRAEWQLWWRS